MLHYILGPLGVVFFLFCFRGPTWGRLERAGRTLMLTLNPQLSDICTLICNLYRLVFFRHFFITAGTVQNPKKLCKSLGSKIVLSWGLPNAGLFKKQFMIQVWLSSLSQQHFTWVHSLRFIHSSLFNLIHSSGVGKYLSNCTPLL